MAALIQNYSSRPAGSPNSPTTGVDMAQWSANPYANFDYRHTWWQKLWEGLGFRSKFDEYRDSMALNANEYESQLLEKAHNEEFDSPAAQAARYRAAGINPDINGDVSPGSSSGMEPDPNAPISPGFNDPVPIVQGFGNMVMSAFTGAIGLANSITGMLGSLEDLKSKKSANLESIVGQAIDLVHRNVPDVFPQGSDLQGMLHLGSNGYFEDLAEPYADEAGFNSSQKRLFLRAVRDYARSAPSSAEAYKTWYEQGENRQKYAKLHESDYFSEIDSTLFDLIEPLSKAYDRVLKAQPSAEAASLEASEAQSNYDAALSAGLDPALAANVENTTNKRNLASSEIDAILNEALNEIVTNLRDRSESGKKGHGFATIAVLVFSVLRMMNFSRTSGIQSGKPVNTTSFGF